MRSGQSTAWPPQFWVGVLPGKLYMTGMLHGVGKLLMAIHNPHEFSLCLKKARELKLPLHQVEIDVFGTTDALVAAAVLKSWNLPPNICQGVAFHQMPELAPPEHITIAGLTQFAYVIAGMSGHGCNGDGLGIDLAATYLGQLPQKFSEPEVQERLVQEIVNSLDGKSDKVTFRAPEPQVKGRVSKKTDITAKTPILAEPAKKGVFSWIKSLWR